MTPEEQEQGLTLLVEHYRSIVTMLMLQAGLTELVVSAEELCEVDMKASCLLLPEGDDQMSIRVILHRSDA